MSDSGHPQRPLAVTWAFWVWVLATGVGLVGAAILLAEVPRSGRLLAESLDDSNRAIAVGVTLAVWALTRLVFAWFLLKGRGWARVLLTTLAGLGLAAVMVRVEHGGPLNWVAIVMNGVAIVLQFLPSSNAYFAQSEERMRLRERTPEDPPGDIQLRGSGGDSLREPATPSRRRAHPPGRNPPPSRW